MVEHGYITTMQADAAWAEPLALKPLKQVYDSKYPHFIQYTRSQVEQTLGPQLTAKGGLRIYTTLDPQRPGDRRGGSQEAGRARWPSRTARTPRWSR